MGPSENCCDCPTTQQVFSLQELLDARPFSLCTRLGLRSHQLPAWQKWNAVGICQGLESSGASPDTPFIPIMEGSGWKQVLAPFYTFFFWVMALLLLCAAPEIGPPNPRTSRGTHQALKFPLCSRVKKPLHASGWSHCGTSWAVCLVSLQQDPLCIARVQWKHGRP